MKKTLTLLIAAITLIIACKKDSPLTPEPGGTNPPGGGTTTPPATTVGIKTDAANYLPGQLITLTIDKPITRDTISVTMGGTKVTLTKMSDTQYGFVLPVLAQGDYTLNLSALGVTTNPTVNIKTYTPIASPTTVINGFKSGLSVAIDTLQARTATDTTGVSTNNTALLKQLQAQFDKAMLTATDADKQQIAYFIQSSGINFNETFTATETIDPAYLVNSASNPLSINSLITNSTKLKTNSIFSEISERWINVKSKFVGENIAIGKAVALVGIAILLAPTAPLAAVVCGVIGGVYLVRNIEGVAKLGAEVYNAAIKEEEFTADLNPASTGQSQIAINALNLHATTGPAAFTTNKPLWLIAKGVFRTITSADASDPVLGDAVSASAKFQENDNLIKTQLDQLKSRTGNLLDKVTSSYKKHTLSVRSAKGTKTVQLDNAFITVTEVSNPDITLAVTNDGTKGLKILASNPSKNLKAKTDFTFKINYTQQALNNKVSKVQAATYTPTVDSVALLKAKAWNAYEYFYYDPETRQQTANVIGNTINKKDNYVICVLNSTGKEFCSSWSYTATTYSSVKFTFGDTFVSTITGTPSLGTYGAENASDCVAGKQHVESYASSTSTGNYGEYRVLNGWLEYKVNNEWYPYYKIITLNATDFVVETYGSATQVTLTYNFGNGRYSLTSGKTAVFAKIPGTENKIASTIRFR